MKKLKKRWKNILNKSESNFFTNVRMLFLELLLYIMGVDINHPGQCQLDVGLHSINDRMPIGKHFQILVDGHDKG